MNDSNIKQQTVSGLKWSALDNIASQGITFIIGIILARLLSPEEFGTLGIALIYIGLFNQIVDCGFSNALIRKRNATNIDFNTAFIFNIIISILLYLICIVIIPYISHFFKDGNLIKVLHWLSILVIINAISIIQRTILIKKIDFKTQTKISLVSSIIGGLIGLILAFYKFGVMSLVFQQLSRQTLNSLLLWVYNNWRPKLEFSIVSFKEQFSYGIKLLFSGLIDFICNESASILIGKVYAPATLGQYSRAKQFSAIFSSNLSMVMQRVTYPVLSKFQENKIELVSKYKIIVKCLMLISGYFMISLACTAKPIVILLIGDKWIEAAVFLQIICFNDLFYPIKQVNINVIQVAGRSDFVLKVTILKRILQAIPIGLGLISIYYMLYGLVIASILGLLLNMYYASKCIPYTLQEQLSDLSKPFSICAFTGVLMWTVTLFEFSLILQLIIQLSLGSTLFITFSRRLQQNEYNYIKEIIFSTFRIKSK